MGGTTTRDIPSSAATKAAWSVAPHDGDFLDGARHLHDRQLDDAVRHPRHVDAQLAGEAPDGGLRTLGIEADLAAERPGGAEAREHDVGVGDGRLFAAAPVAGRPRRGARRPRPHVEELAGAEPRDAAAAGADAVDLDLEHLVGEGAHAPLGGHGEPPVSHEADVGARPAHVVRDEVGVTGRTAHVGGADDAGGRAREHGVDGEIDDALRGERPPV
jgi:hypothetical protein